MRLLAIFSPSRHVLAAPASVARAFSQIALAGVTTSVALALAGCAVGPNFHAPAKPQGARLTQTPLPAHTVATAIAGGTAQTFMRGRDVPGDWWALFHSRQISHLVRQALKDNPTLAAAQATLLEAKENRRAAEGGLVPQVKASAQMQRTRQSLAAFGLGKGGTTYSLGNGALDISYTLDAFGGIRRQVEALDAQATYQRFEMEGAELTLTTNLVETAITAAALQARIETTRHIIQADRDALRLVQQRFQLGGVSQADVLQQQALLDAQLASLPGLQKQREQAENQLSVYLGGRPGQFDLVLPRLTELTLPAALPVSLPTQLVEQRPDIRAYEALLHAATANVGVATANMLPQLTLSGSYGRTGNDFANLFTPSGIVWTIASAISAPVFEGGTLDAQRKAAEAALHVAAAQYSATVNTAFQNVADVLVAIRRDAETLQASLAAQQTAATSLALARAQYAAGAGSYLTVLTAEQADYSARLNLITARAARFTDTVALFQALGGGWWHRNDVSQTVAQCCGVMP